MKISIIIPALNEEKLLARLLESIKEQTFTDYEVIVADAHSTDRTRSVAEEAGARVVNGGLPAAGRNAGARAARGDFFFFFDSDVVLPPDFLQNAYEEMQDKWWDLATCKFYPISPYRLDRVVHRVMNLAVILNLRFDPKAFGFAIFCTKRLFERVNGFDETIYVAEDNDFVKRGAAVSPLHYLTRASLLVSVRRLEKEGRLAYIKKGIVLNLYRYFKGEIRDEDVVKYEFDAFDKSDDADDNAFLDKIEAKLLEMERKSEGLPPVQTEKTGMLDEWSSIYDEVNQYLTKRQKKAAYKKVLRGK